MRKHVNSFANPNAECHFAQLATFGREWKENSCSLHFKGQCNFFLTIVSVATPSQSSAQCYEISGWLPRPPSHPPSSNTEAETRKSLPSGMQWGGWTTRPAKCKIQVNKFYKMKSWAAQTHINSVHVLLCCWWWLFTLSSSRPERMAVSGVTPSSSSSAVPSIDLFNSFTRALKQQF